ncbi:discoidin domain-containing protein [Umezawaea sp. Da 62-37]|uniref:discoidin domain-containing protein n=1 Tax=Umezawaea sp. Da 62-37 TaxID=3075927 RepID=UPI0028F6C451|nr:discoidin domain-containing protein [Umezawaea sp. Da 62-37]WNV86343.1 discoidin domain-containing protein [Umezawaea sp. Da 62-37]
MTRKQVNGLIGAILAVGLVTLGMNAPTAVAAGGPNLAAGKTAAASATNPNQPASNINDGNQDTYWESPSSSFPQWVQIDLGGSVDVDQVVLKLPSSWGARTQTLTVQGSSNGTAFSALAGSAARVFDPAASNTATIDFTAASVRYVRVDVTANTGWPAAQISEFEVHGAAAATGNLAAGRTMSASSSQGEYPASNTNDGNQNSYWESNNNAFPQWLQVDLGASVGVNRVVLKLPASWGSRSQTLAVQGSANGTSFTDLVGSAAYSFAPANSNTATVSFTATTTRYVRLAITANTVQPGGQLSEFEVYGPTSGDQQAPTAPGGLAFTEQTSGQVRLTWTASTDNVGVTGYDVYANGQVRGTVAGNVLTYTDTQPVTTTVEYLVRARDAAGNQSADSNRVTRAGQGGGDTAAPTAPGGLAFTQPTTGQIRLTWTASTDNVGVTGYDVFVNGQVTGVAGNQLTFTDTQPATATVEYFVRARDAAGNQSADSNHVTRTGQVGSGSNLARGKAIEASSTTFSFVAANANDDSLATYWESAGFESTLSVKLGSNADVSSVVVKLNPDSAWGTRTQTFEVLGREQSGTSFGSLKALATYSFNPASQNTVTIPVTGRVSDVRLRFTANSGAPGAQVAEFQVIGTPAPNPDLVVTAVTWTPTSPNETSAISLSATVKNNGTAAAAATTVDFSLAGTVVGSTPVGALAAGASATVSAAVGTRPMGSYSVSALVDPTNKVVEQDDTNNRFTAATQLVVAQAPGPDLQVTGVTTNPANPAVGSQVTFTVSVNNRGTSAVAAGTVTRVTVGGTTLNGTTGAIAAGATATATISGSWTATNGGATITATADATNTVAETNENNNAFSQSIVVGRGAAVPYTEYEAESARYQGTLLTADAVRTFGHTNFATESSGRQSVRLNSTGQFVEFTSTNQANSIVVRNSIPDAPGGGGIDATISLYVNDAFAQKLTLSSKHSWLYGNVDGPEALTNTPQADARRLFDESHALLSTSYPAGTRFKLQRDAADSASFYILDLIDLEQVAPATSQPAGCTSITSYGAVPNDGVDDTDALQRAVTDDQNGVIGCVWIPEGQWRQEKKILTDDPLNRGQFNQVGISNVTIRGAGMWRSQLYTLTEPQNAVGSINHPHEGNFGFDIDKNTQISDIAILGSGRIRGGDGNAEGGVGLNGRFGTGTKISNVWIEHANVGVWVGRDYDNIPDLWGPADGLEFSGMRIRDTYADGINFSNGTRNSKVFNSSFRTTGDDAMAVWANRYVKDPNVDIGHDNHFVNNTVQLPWRATGIAIYGGYGNSIENNLVYDTMNYPGIMLATDHDPLPFSGTTLIANNGLYRCGGVFWGEDQEFGALTLFAASKDITGVTIRDTDISDSTYDGIQFKTGGGTMPGVVISNVKIDKSNNGSGILAMSGARGSATLTNVTITNSAQGNILVEPGSGFVITGGTSIAGRPARAGGPN